MRASKKKGEKKTEKCVREVETAQLCRIQLHTDGEERLVSESAQACIGVTRYDYKIDFFFWFVVFCCLLASLLNSFYKRYFFFLFMYVVLYILGCTLNT